MTLSADHRKALRTAGQKVPEWTEKRNEAIRAAIANGATLREVGEAVGLSHQAVKFIAHGRG